MFDRKDIDAKYKWDLTKIYPTEDDFKKDYEEVGTDSVGEEDDGEEY